MVVKAVVVSCLVTDSTAVLVAVVVLVKIEVTCSVAVAMLVAAVGAASPYDLTAGEPNRASGTGVGMFRWFASTEEAASGDTGGKSPLTGGPAVLLRGDP